MTALVTISQALEPIAQTIAPKFSVEVSYPTAQVTVELKNNTLIYSIDIEAETDCTRIYSDEAECLVLTVTVAKSCTVTAYDEEGDEVYETMIKTPAWIHTDAAVEIEEAMSACEY